MRGVGFDRYVEIAVFTVFGFFVAMVGVSLYVGGGEGELAIGAVFLFMVLFLMFFLEVDVVELATGGAAFDVPAAVSKMCGYFAFGELL